MAKRLKVLCFVFATLLTTSMVAGFSLTGYYGRKCIDGKSCIASWSTYCNSSNMCDCKKRYILKYSTCLFDSNYCDSTNDCFGRQYCDYDKNQCVCKKRYVQSSYSKSCSLKKGFCEPDRYGTCPINEFCNSINWRCECENGYVREKIGNRCQKMYDPSEEAKMSRSEKLGWILGGSFGAVVFLACCFGGYIGVAINKVKKGRREKTCFIEFCMSLSGEDQAEASSSTLEYPVAEVSDQTQTSFQTPHNPTPTAPLDVNVHQSSPSVPTSQEDPPPTYHSLFTHS